jgi:hypothetical protein
MKRVLALVVVMVGLSVVSGQGLPESRAFRLGFTPFPYALSVLAVEYTYDRIAEDADLMAHHFDNGVPWVEALAGEPYNDNIRDDWNWRLSQTSPDMPVLLTTTPINFERDGLAPYRGAEDDMPLPAPWDRYGFDHPDVIAAYTQYTLESIAFFQPDYFLMGIEVNLLMKLRPDLWDAYMTLHRAVYSRLKQEHPNLPVFVSVTGIDLLEGYTDVNHTDQMQALADLTGYTDLLGLSLYPYFTVYMTNSIPMEMFDQLAALTDLPLAVTETGYPGEAFTIQLGEGPRLEFEGTPEKQAAYIDLLLSAAHKHEMAFVINFIVRDYDELWQTIGGQEDLTIAWRDTGLYDGAGAARPALERWRAWLALPLMP